MNNPKRARPLNRSVGTIDDVMVVVTVIRARRRGGSAHYCSYAPADRRTDTGAMSAACDRPDCCSGASAYQTAADCAVGGIVWVRESGGRQQ